MLDLSALIIQNPQINSFDALLLMRVRSE